MPKETTVKLTASEAEAMKNVFKYLRADEKTNYEETDLEFQDDHIYSDVMKLEAVLFRAGIK